MELLVENDHVTTAVSIELGADLSRHSLGDLREALGLAATEDDHRRPLTEVGLHRGMLIGGAGGTPPASAHLAAGWRPDHAGRFPVVRPPHDPLPRPIRAAFPDAPEPPEPPPPLPFSTVLPLLTISGLMAWFWSPTFALLGAASALIPLARALGPRLLRRRHRRRHAAALAAHLSVVAHIERTWREATAEWLERQVSSPGELDRLVASAGLRPWTRRQAVDRPLALAIGRGALRMGHDADGGRASDRGDRFGAVPLHQMPLNQVPLDQAPLDQAPLDQVPLDEVPLVLEVERGIAVTGDRRDVLALARWIGIETAFRFGPADLDVTVFTTVDRRPDWEWIRWLPGLRGVEVDSAAIDAAGAGLADDTTQHLVIVDGPMPTGPGSFARLLGGQVAPARVVWLGAACDVPAVCESTVAAIADGFVQTGGGEAAGWCWRLSVDEAEEFARFLAPFVDPDVAERAVALPASVPLAQLCPLGAGAAGAADLADRWRRVRRGELLVPLGVTSDGPLVVDLVADGPHALVAGTTGAGKSELLRSFVVGAAVTHSPKDLAFVLVDFKGGGAFDAVASLPHVAAVVTDLEPSHAMRALRSLRAELQHRELVLRHHRVSDVAQLEAGDDPPPRLLVVVDEFAALAEELPAFLDGLVDVARRGRSLGVHLILATQRPAGVVTNEIRANTNLRICLRVRDAADSADVIDSVDAAALPSIPGRAIVTVGGERRRLAQIAYLRGASLLEPRPFTLAHTSAGSVPSSSWLAGVVEAVVACHPARVRAPWLPALPASFAVEQLWAIGPSDHAETTSAPVSPIGVLDDADRRAQLPIEWSPRDGGVVVAAADPARLAATISTIVGALALDEPNLEVLILDGSGGLLDRLAILRSVADVIHHREPERLARALSIAERRRRRAGAGTPDLVVVVHRWASVVDALGDTVGPDASLQFARLFGDRSIVPVIGVTSAGEMPSRVLAMMGRRLIHRLADGNAGFVFDVHPSDMPVGGAGVFDVDARLPGVIGDLSDHALARVAAWSSPATPPSPVRVLAERMPLAALPRGFCDDDRWMVPIAFDEDLAPVFVELSPLRRFVILGRPGSGRSTAITAVVAGLERLGLADGVEVIDDADRLTADEAQQRLAEAEASGRRVVLASSPTAARSFGSWLTPLLGDAVVLLLNPSRIDGEALRVVVPDLSQGPVGRSVILDRGRVAIVHVAIDDAA